MELRSSKLTFSRVKPAHSARSRLLRPQSVYKSINSTSTTFTNHSPAQKRPIKDTQKEYLTTRAQSAKYASLSSTCWCLYDQNAKIELGFRKNKQREIASLTKIMTTLAALELKKKYNISPNTLIRVTQAATKNIGTSAGLKAHSWLFLKDLFYGIMLPSGNDAAHLMAEFMGCVLIRAKRDENFNPEKMGLVDLTRESTLVYVAQFVKHMNERADKLGMASTRFSNPHGLQNAMNISTAKDVLTLSMHASKNSIFRAIMNAEFHRYHQYSGDESRAIKTVKSWQNTNILLRQGWQGIKTGLTPSAGGCLASLREGVYIVVLNCPDSLKRFTQTKRLYEWYTEKGRLPIVASSISFQF